MNTKQKKTLLGAIVALVLVGTIVVVALALNGNFSSPKDDEAIKKVVKAVADALVDLEKEGGENKYHLGGVYIKVQEQWLDDKGQKTKEADKKKTITLKKVTVYGAKVAELKVAGNDVAKEAAIAALNLAIKDKVEDQVVVIGEAVEFKDGEVDGEGKKQEDYPVFKRVLAELKVKLGDKFGEAVDVKPDSTEMFHFVEVTKKA